MRAERSNDDALIPIQFITGPRFAEAREARRVRGMIVIQFYRNIFWTFRVFRRILFGRLLFERAPRSKESAVATDGEKQDAGEGGAS